MALSCGQSVTALAKQSASKSQHSVFQSVLHNRKLLFAAFSSVMSLTCSPYPQPLNTLFLSVSTRSRHAGLFLLRAPHKAKHTHSSNDFQICQPMLGTKAEHGMLANQIVPCPLPRPLSQDSYSAILHHDHWPFHNKHWCYLIDFCQGLLNESVSYRSQWRRPHHQAYNKPAWKGKTELTVPSLCWTVCLLSLLCRYRDMHSSVRSCS